MTLEWQGIEWEPGFEIFLYEEGVIRQHSGYFNPAALERLNRGEGGL